jgi:2-isopropylmalate synthase
MPHVFASQVEYMSKNLKYRENVVLSLHPHNDRGCGISDAELGLLAGADRIEGTLFGNGERTGNVDIVTLGMNLFAHGVDPKLDFSGMAEIAETYERLTGMTVSMRQPYAGSLVFTAFSGSHQDAISKGMACREKDPDGKWTVPYLPIDPKDVGRTYDADVIRINSQSGKGGVSYVLKHAFGISIPDKMREELGYIVKDVSDKGHKELTPDEVYQIFKDTYKNVPRSFAISECHFRQKNGIEASVSITKTGENETVVVEGKGNGRLDAVSNAIKQHFGINYLIDVYEEHALNKGSSSRAMAFVGIKIDEKIYWGVGMHEDIITASIDALCAAINRWNPLNQ